MLENTKHDLSIRNGFQLLDLIEVERLQNIQDTFAKATGVASIITDVEGNPITQPSNFIGVCQLIRATAKGTLQCVESDRLLGEEALKTMQPTYRACESCGFADASAPIIVGDQHIGNWLIGQSNPMGVDRQRIEEYALEIGADPAAMVQAFDEMPQMTLEKFKQILDLLWHIANEISDLAYNNLALKAEIVQREQLQQQIIEAQQQAIQELSTPVIPVIKGIIIMPLVGNIDSMRAKDVMRTLLAGISEHRAQVVILDITGVPMVDTGIANHLDKTIQAARLKGTQTIVTGMSDAVAETIVDLGIDWSRVETLRNLESGLMVALKRVGLKLC